ncbi:HK97-gp10 family putative phage morphogenesis protein [Staphylococcus chromogenes]|uniref:HK97-gp10 family putative phage morphogenesis protein n=1 Tax=Staphylococcus chromogenes TaxID=46126 RepID=UPI001890A36E|nr:HK97-gp10 family putative phage morphogenesis protein [Staphylococcus chromogenes]
MASIDNVIAHLKHMHDDIDDDVDKVLRDNAEKFAVETVKSARQVMTQGYWTGNLARQVQAAKTGHLDYTITSNAYYSGFLEFGTRKMRPYTFMRQVYQAYDLQVRADLQQLLDG